MICVRVYLHSFPISHWCQLPCARIDATQWVTLWAARFSDTP